MTCANFWDTEKSLFSFGNKKALHRCTIHSTVVKLPSVAMNWTKIYLDMKLYRSYTDANPISELDDKICNFYVNVNS